VGELGFRGYEQKNYWAVAAALVLGGLLATSTWATSATMVYKRIAGPVPQENVVTIFPHTSAGLVLFVCSRCSSPRSSRRRFFRGFVLSGPGSLLGPLVGAVTSALIFALWHQQLSVLVPIFGLGLLSGGGLLLDEIDLHNIAFHATFNTLASSFWWFAKGK